MMRSTVGLVVILALGLVGRALAATPPKRVPVLGVLLSFAPPAESEWKQQSVFLQELRTLGWREGENLTIAYPARRPGGCSAERTSPPSSSAGTWT
jgi:hypothetical protein